MTDDSVGASSKSNSQSMQGTMDPPFISDSDIPTVKKKKNKKIKSSSVKLDINNDQIDGERTDSANVELGKNKKMKGKDKVAKQEEEEGDDAAESVDSGFAADNCSDTSSTSSNIDWAKVQTLLLGQSSLLSSLSSWHQPATKTERILAEEGSKKRKLDHISSKSGIDGKAKGRSETAATPGTPKGKGILEKNDINEENPANKKIKSEGGKSVRFEDEPQSSKGLSIDLKKAKDKSSISAMRAECLEQLRDVKKLLKRKKIDPKDVRQKERIKKKLSVLERKEKLANKQKGKKDTSAADDTQNTKARKGIYNKKGQLVFSKFDFSATDGLEDLETSLTPKNLQAMLTKALKEKEKIKDLEKKNADAAVSMREKKAWATAMQKAEGVKVKDDLDKLQKTIKMRKNKKKSSQKKWDQRLKAVEKKKEEKQEKRTHNIKKRQKQKLEKKMARMKKKGHIVPGF